METAPYPSSQTGPSENYPLLFLLLPHIHTLALVWNLVIWVLKFLGERLLGFLFYSDRHSSDVLSCWWKVYHHCLGVLRNWEDRTKERRLLDLLNDACAENKSDRRDKKGHSCNLIVKVKQLECKRKIFALPKIQLEVSV